MSTVINYLISLFGGVYFLLILKGVVRLSPEKQIRFDEKIKKKKAFYTLLAYLLIFISIISAILDLYLTN